MSFAAAEMVVVGAKDDIFAGFSGKIRQDVIDGGVNSFDVHGKGKN